MVDSALAPLTAASALGDTDLFYTVQGGADRKATGLQIKTYAGGGLTIGTTSITSGTTLRLLYDNAGVVGETAGVTFTGGTGDLTLAGSISVGGSIVYSNAQVFGGLWINTTSNASIRMGQSNTGQAGLFVTNNGQSEALGFLSGNYNNAADTVFTRGGAAIWQMGFVDAAAPVAQTLTVQSVAAGTSNTAGADFTIAGSKGTGTGAGGSLILRVAKAGSTGTSQNALIDTVKLSSAGVLTLTGNSIGGTSSGTGFAMTLGYNAANNKQYWLGDPDYIGNASSTFLRVLSLGGFTQISAISGDGNNNQDVEISSTNNLLLASGVLRVSTDVYISRAAAATLQLGQADNTGPFAQTLTVQSVVAGTSNGSGSDFTISGSKGTGTAASGNIIDKTGFSAKSTGTSQHTTVDRKVIVAKGKVLTSAAAFSIFDVALPTLSMCGGVIEATIICTDGADMQSFTQTATYSAVNKGGVYTTSITPSTGDKSVSAGTLTTSWTVVSGTNKVTIKVTPTTSLTPSANSFLLYYTIKNNSEQLTAIL